MNRRDFIGVMGAAAAAAAGGQAATSDTPADGQNRSGPSRAVPTAEELAGEWMNFADLHTLPSVNSPWGGCQVGNDLWSIAALTLPPFTQGGSSGNLHINGQAILVAKYRWFPHEVLRQARVAGTGLECISSVRMSHQNRAVFFQLHLINHRPHQQNVELDADLTAMIRSEVGVWQWWLPRPQNPADFRPISRAGDQIVTIQDTHSAAATSFAFLETSAPEINHGIHSATAHWRFTLAPRGVRTVAMVMAVADDPRRSAQLARISAAGYAGKFAECRANWQQQFDAAFTPDNKIYSGFLPTLETTDTSLRRAYYMSVASLLTLLRRCFSTAKNAYITIGPQQGASLMYFWDTFTWSTLHALLDPVNMKNMLRRWLELDVHSCYAQDMNSGKGVGPWYSFNDYVVFHQIYTYISVTGDSAFLDERIAGRPLLDHLSEMAFWWKRLVRPGSPLADYGNADNLLECVPTYTHVVASLNAANVWMMRHLAKLLAHTGHRKMAADTLQQARQMAREVIKLYVPGAGYWNTVHPGGHLVAVRHCIDFFTVGTCMTNDLSPSMKMQMCNFVEGHLLTDHWMRALAMDDPAAPMSNRPDHGPMGAYDAWPPFTMDALCRLGQWTLAANFLRRCVPATREGCFGQSHELLTASLTSPVRKAYRGGQMYNASCSGAFADVILRTFFGVEFTLDAGLRPYAPHAERGFVGTLTNVRTHDAPAAGSHSSMWAIHSGVGGLRLEKR